MAWLRKRESNGCIFTDLLVVAMPDVVQTVGEVVVRAVTPAVVALGSVLVVRLSRHQP